MANFTTSPAMNLPIPVVGVAPGPDWATYVNNCLTLIDQHVHSAGTGNAITPDGININGDLSFNTTNAIALRSTRFTAQSGTLNGASDVGCVYVSGIDLYFNDGAGNKIRITQSAGVAGTPGSIANLVSPASATYSGAGSTFIWQSNANVAANLDAGSVIFRNLTASSNGVTVSAPNALGANYVLTLPAAPPASTKIVSMDSTGALAPVIDADGSTVQIVSNLIGVKPNGITTNEILNAAVTPAKLSVTATTVEAFYPSSGSFVPPAGITRAWVEGAGGGGGGGSGGAGIGGTAGGGGGGGSGAVPQGKWVTVVPGATYAVTIGAGGGGGSAVGGSSNGNAGSSGSPSSFGALLSFPGGLGGGGGFGSGTGGAFGSGGGGGTGGTILFPKAAGGGGGSGGGGGGGVPGASGETNLAYAGGAGAFGGGGSIGSGGGGGGGGSSGFTGGAGGIGGTAGGGSAGSAGTYGSGGGGGGGMGNNNGASGAGGAGGNGYIKVIYGLIV